MFSSIKTFVSTWFTRAMTEPEVNSRLVFLVAGFGSVVSVLALVIGFMVSKNHDGYDYMVAAVSTGTISHGVSRYLTKGKLADPVKGKDEETT